MLAIAKPAEGDLLYFTFGEILDPRELPIDARLKWIFENYEGRRNELILAPPTHVAAWLQDRLSDTSDPEQLLLYIRALGFLRAVGPAASIYPFLDHPDKRIAQESILALGRIGSRASLPRLERFLQSPDPDIRKAAITALSKRLSRGDFQQVDAAAGTNPELRLIVRKGKRRMEAFEAKDSRAFVIATLDTDEWEDLWPGLNVFAPYVLEVLADNKRSLELRRRALSLFTIVGHKDVRGLLEQILQEGGELRAPAITAAGRSRATNCVEILAEILNDADLDLARLIVRALGDIRSPNALVPLLSKWSVYDGALRLDLRIALLRLGRVAGPQRLADLLRSGAPWSPSAIYFVDDRLQLQRKYSVGLLDGELQGSGRLDAVVLLGFLGEPAEAPKLEPLAAADEASEIRQLARLAIGRMLSAAK